MRSNNSWQPHRAGLLNFWYYDEEEFDFADGKLLLRGTNGSGKSVTMQSLITVLLDGKKSPERLDPFGSQARRMEDYLLGEKEVVDRDERTGYLYMEYKRKRSEQYLTTGIGLRAKRHSGMDFWGFLVLDNRRIGHDFKLYTTEINPETGKPEKIPLSRKQLENRLEQGGYLVTSQREYMELVNKHLFGFESLEAYDELMKLLIQLRSPKLSKDFKPTVIYEILNHALPALSDDELRPLSDTIEHMDQAKQQLDQLLRDEQATAKLCKKYDEYNEMVLTEKAFGFVAAHRRVVQLDKKSRQLEAQAEQYRRELDALSLREKELRTEQRVLQEERGQLESHDVFRTEAELGRLKEELRRLEDQLRHKERDLELKQKRERELNRRLDELEAQMRTCEREMDELAESLGMDAEEARFEAHAMAETEWRRDREHDPSFALWKQEARNYLDLLELALKKLREQTFATERLKQLDLDLGEARKRLDLQTVETDKWRRLFEEERSALLASLHEWQAENLFLKLTDEQLQETARRADRLCDDFSPDQVAEPAREAYQRIQGEMAERMARLKAQMSQLEDRLAEKRDELKEWKEKKDPEPDRHAETIASRCRLQEQGIPCVPFYAAVEFADHVSDEDRERLESALDAMGVLDALIVPEDALPRVQPESDRVLRPEPQLFGHTLADWLIPTPVEGIAVSSAEIMNVLTSFTIGDVPEGSASVAENGRYRIGLLDGHAPGRQGARFIGREARRKYRQAKIAQLEEECAELTRHLQEVRAALQRAKDDKFALDAELRRFPSCRQAVEAYGLWQSSRQMEATLQSDVERKNEQVKAAAAQLHAIRQELQSSARHIRLELKEEAFEEARGFMRRYVSDLGELEVYTGRYVHLRGQRDVTGEQREETMADVDLLKGEFSELKDLAEQRRAAVRAMERMLTEMGADEIRRRISEVLQRLGELPDAIVECSKAHTALQKDLERTEEGMDGLRREMELACQLLSLWQATFREEEKLRFTVPDEGGPAVEELGEDDLLKRAAHWAGRVKEDGDRGKLLNKLIAEYYEAQRVLVEYRLHMDESAPAALPLDPAALPDTYRTLFEEWRQKDRRSFVFMEYNGKRVSPYFMKRQLELDIERQRHYLQEKDRELFEEIILNSVGRMIRSRIGRAERWVEQMDRLMSERDTSSGLRFAIRWKPKTAEREDEMDTEDLVRLLRTDARLLRDEDMERVTRHFRSKVNRAKELMEGGAYGETLHNVIKDMLDYRKWFSFTLYYRREGENRKELTNRAFYTFSGGEKAMAMYIPLFCAAYSRYMEARDDAPYLISLDEAFAGVDENNIRDMFDLVEKLGFSYIMNSQALWGDYDTVSSLSICELVRPKNAPFVTVVRYRWDGRMLALLQHAEAAATKENTERDDEDGP